MQDDTAQQAVNAFVARNFSLRGSLGLHRHAIGWDLLRAPANVSLAPVFVLQRLIGALLSAFGARRLALRLCAHPLMFRTAVAEELDRRLRADLLAPLDLLPEPRGIRDYVGTRSATNEIATTLGTVGFGAVTLKTLTPGVLSLAPALTAVMAQGAAIASFPLGGALGAVWYGAFPSQVPVASVVVTGAVLVVILSLCATFVGLVTDPLQRRLGLHQRRLMRLVRVLEVARPFAAPEHYVARSGDLADAAASALRWFRG